MPLTRPTARARPTRGAERPPAPDPAKRGPTPASRSRAHSRHTSALAAQRIFSFAGVRLAPAVAAAIVAALHSGLGAGALLGLGVLFCASALERKRWPLHLMPLGGALARALAPLAGVIGGWLLSLTLSPMPPGELAAPLGAAWVVLAAVLAIGHRVESGFPVRVAVIGSPGLALALEAELETFNVQRWQVVGWMDFTDDGLTASTDGPPLLGFVQEMAEVIDHNAIDLIVFGVRESEREAGSWLGVDSIGVLERVVETCVGLDVRVIGANQFFEEAFGHVPLAAINAAWFQFIMHPRFRAASPVGKRALDLGVAALVSIFALPLIAAAAVAIKLNDRGPTLYRQRRVGEAGREFEILKLRTMRLNAESNGAQWAAATDDPRVTSVGRVLRRTHLDELPQLWNVLRGDMSIVGPRPERPEFVRELERKLPFYDRRLVVKPGVTGWAQVSCGYAGTHSGSMWKLAHDLFYLKHRSTLFDLLIIVETLATPVRDARRANREPATAFVKRAERAHAVESTAA